MGPSPPINALAARCTSKMSATTPSMQGKICLVTGANAGLGFATAARLATLGAKVILACRDMPSAEHAAAELRQMAPKSPVEPAGST